MSRRWLVPLFTAAALALAVSAEAHWSVTTKSCCSFLCKRYKATARATCSAVLFTQQTTTSCGAVSASASRSCIVGGASASSFNGPAGWGGSGSASGLGSYGDAAPNDNRRGPGGFAATQAEGTIEMDAARNAAVLRLAKSFIAAADRAGAHSTLTLTVWLSKGGGDDEVATPENTIWSAEIHVAHGKVSLTGDLSAKEVRVEHGDGFTSVTLADLLRFVPVPPGQLADVAFTAEGDGGGTGARIPLDLPAPDREQTLLDPGEGCPLLAFLPTATPAS